MKLIVKYLDGTEQEVVRTASALRAFEKSNGMHLQSAMTVGSWWADEIAHHVLKQKHGESRSFDQWLDDVETIVWERPKREILAVCDALGYKIADEAEVPEVDPSGGAEAEASRADSSEPPTQ